MTAVPTPLSSSASNDFLRKVASKCQCWSQWTAAALTSPAAEEPPSMTAKC